MSVAQGYVFSLLSSHDIGSITRMDMNGYVFGVIPWRAFLTLHRPMDGLGFGTGTGWDMDWMGSWMGRDLHTAYACGDFLACKAAAASTVM